MFKKLLLTSSLLILLLLAYASGGPSPTLAQTIPPAVPLNDNFQDAIVVGSLPFNTAVDITLASMQEHEPIPSCAAGYPFSRTVWYAFTPTTSGSFLAKVSDWYYSRALAIYTGATLANLTQIGCQSASFRPLVFQANAGTTYYFQVGDLYSNGSTVSFSLELTPPPQAGFYFYPSDSSRFDTIQFSNSSVDPGEQGIQSWVWDFGDGATSTDLYPSHHYPADGDYTVQLEIATTDGRTDSITQTVTVRTHEVAITKLVVPKVGRENRTRQVLIGVNNKDYPEIVRVELWKGTPGGYQPIGSSLQLVPVTPGKRTTNFVFNYTFTSEDAAIGKVTFRAVAYLQTARDALPADNEAISFPILVRAAAAAAAAEDLAAEEAVVELELAPVNSPDEVRSQPGESHVFLPLVVN
jgi:PKD repeat protein